MKYYSAEEIIQMKSNGYDPAIVREIEEYHQKVERICRLIAEAFKGVELGGGIGLRQAQGIDDYKSESQCLEYRAADEKFDWRRIPVAELTACYSSLSFFDAEGMRFHLPAFLIADLRGQFHQGMAFCLCSHASGANQFSDLSKNQRLSVREYLLHIAEDPNYEFDRPDILRAVKEYWYP